LLKKEAREMRKTLENFYYGNITPSEGDVVPSSNLRRAMVNVARRESQLAEKLDSAGQPLLTELVKTRQEIEDITALENFILGFRLGVRLMIECMDENDGDIKYGGD